MSLLFLQPATYEHYYPRRHSRVPCHCGMPEVYEDNRYPHFYTLRRPQPRPSSQVPLFAHILSCLLQGESESDKEETHHKDGAATGTGSTTDPIQPKKFEAKFYVKGFSPDEINVRIKEDQFLEVHAKHEEKSENGSIYREYKRLVRLPHGTDPEHVIPVLSTDGVLTVRVPVPQAIAKEERGSKDSDVEVRKQETGEHERDNVNEDSCSSFTNGQKETATITTTTKSLQEGEEATQVLSSGSKHDSERVKDYEGFEMQESEETNSCTESTGQKDDVATRKNPTESEQCSVEEGIGTETAALAACSDNPSADEEKTHEKAIKIDIVHE